MKTQKEIDLILKKYETQVEIIRNEIYEYYNNDEMDEVYEYIFELVLENYIPGITEDEEDCIIEDLYLIFTN